MARALLPIGLATRRSIVLPAVCSCRFVAVARARLLTRRSMAGCQHCVQLCQRVFWQPCTAWLAIFCSSYARTLRRRDLHCSTVHDVIFTPCIRPYKVGIHHPAQPDETGIFFPRVQAYMQPSGALIFAANRLFPNRAIRPSSRYHAGFCAVNLRRLKANSDRIATATHAAQPPLSLTCKETPANARLHQNQCSLQQQH